jgi:acyl carrier protein
MKEKLLSETEEKIKQILISDLEIEPSILATSDSSTPLLGRGIGLDSVETLTLVAGIEREFDIEIEDDDLTVELFNSIGTLAEYVSQKITEQKGR